MKLSPQPHALAGLTVLLVEDEPLIALDVRSTLEDCACIVLDECSGVAAALKLIDTNRIDIAVLDLNIHKEHTLAVADALMARGVPFVWLSGYNRDFLPEPYRVHPFVGKPFVKHHLLTAMTDAHRGACAAASLS